MAPEMLQYYISKDINSLEESTVSSTDVWSLGITVLEILSGLPIGIQTKCNLKLTTNKQKVSNGILCVKDNHPKRLLKQISQTIGGGYLR